MPVTPTYPGIYIEEVPSNSHTITAAPTSVTVFIGYTHPFKTKPEHYGNAVEIFSFSDYEREFGGLFSVDWLADDVGRAVLQFFLNGGSIAYVVALAPELTLLASGTSATLSNPTLQIPPTGTTAIVFNGLEPVDAYHLLTVSITNLQKTPGGTVTDIADIIVSYGARTETFRHVTLNPAPPPADAGNTLEARIGTATDPVSSLVTVAPPSGGSYPTSWSSTLAPTPLDGGLPTSPFTSYHASDFAAAFAADGSLDKVRVFNLVLTPGVWDPPVVSEALAFCERHIGVHGRRRAR